MNRIKSFFGLILISIIAVSSLCSCESSYPPPGTPHTSGYSDPDLVGTWELANIDGYRVDSYNTHYFDFYHNGTGDYSYYDYGMLHSIGFDYWCEFDYDGAYLYIDYYDGTRSEVAYRFDNSYNTLYMEWWEGSHRRIYTYRFVYYDYHNSPKLSKESPDNSKTSIPKPGMLVNTVDSTK